MKKDFSEVSTDPIYESIMEVSTPEDPNKKKPGRPKKELATTNYKKKLLLALPEELHEYIETMARAKGVPMNQFILDVITEHRKTNNKLYKQIVDIRRKMNGEIE